MIRFASFVCAVTLLSGQGKKPEEYSSHVELDKGITLAADYLVRSLPTPDGGLVADDYLVVEVALFGPSKTRIDVSAGQFELRINGHKTTLSPESPGSVAGSIKYPDWTQHPTVTGTVGGPDGGLIIGPRPPVARFPGDPTVRPSPNPVPVENPGGIEKAPPPSIDDQVASAALAEGDHLLPVHGLIFFEFRGKTKSIKSVELLYKGASLKLL